MGIAQGSILSMVQGSIPKIDRIVGHVPCLGTSAIALRDEELI